MYRAHGLCKVLAAFALTLAMMVLLSAPTRAQEISADHLKVAREAVAASKSTEALDNILPRLAERAKKQLIAARPDEAAQISQIVDDVAITLAPRRGDLEDEVARAYARVFSAEELKRIAAFYNTETGKKLIRETPTVARAIDQAARVWSNGVQRDMRAQVSKKLQEAGLQ